MTVAQRPTTLNSLTHYALTEEQQGMFDPDPTDPEAPIDAEDALMHALQSTPADPSDSRVKSAIASGLLVPELLPSRIEQERLQREGTEEEQEQMRRDEEERRQADEQYHEEGQH